MKSGDSGTVGSIGPEEDAAPIFRYWVLSDKPQIPLGNFVYEWDQRETQKQTDQIKAYLTSTLVPGTWQERSHRFYFLKKEDWETFKTICQIGWR